METERIVSTRDEERVVITGTGLVTPLGVGVEENWKGILAGRGGIGPIKRFNAEGHRVTIAGEVPGFDPTSVVEAGDVKKMDPFIHYALAAAEEALRGAGLERPGGVDPERFGTYVGSGVGGLDAYFDVSGIVIEKGPRRISPFFIPKLVINMAAGQIAIRYQAKGPSLASSTACTTGTHAIGEAWHIIRRGDADVMIAGGSEAAVTPLGIGGFAAMRALSERNDAPERASRPFDKDRDGFVLGEGAGIVVLERLSHAKARGARPIAEVIGYGAACDAFHITAPSEGGEGAARTMALCLRSAGVEPSEVDYVNAHGTSTPFNDKSETRALHAVFGAHAGRLAVSSTKSMIGHLLGAAGAVEAIYTALAISRSVAPPTINYETPDPECDLDYVPNKARPMEIRTAISNSFGFGGTNATLALRRYA